MLGAGLSLLQRPISLSGRLAAAGMFTAAIRSLLRPQQLHLVRAVLSRGYADAPSSAGGMAFTFASPTEVYYTEANVKQVDVPTMTGNFGILPSHVPTLQVLKPGIVTVFDEEGAQSKYFVSSGSVTVNADSSVQLLAEAAAALDALDITAAKANLDKANAELSSASGEIERAEVLISIEAHEAIIKALE
ncbi:ATP synthase subunit delta, mitochondrial [Scyliorhinus canicula]|uniref:ATP synthase subunit delta, mitochondrial n=1 Tax=Scyliorhinus canicula TaxID=7830 RepID=UPI0018F2A05D|nr:ATP synthase subunit delta, mitochondrial [Scyliorhinus canicula]